MDSTTKSKSTSLINSDNSFDLLENDNIYDILNETYVNSFDDIIDDLSNSNIKNSIDPITISSDGDTISFIHNTPVSEAHQRIHEDNKVSKTKKNNSKTTNKKVSSSQSAKNDALKKKLQQRLSEKKDPYEANKSSSLTNRTYTSSQLTSSSTIEDFRPTVTKQKKKSSGLIVAIIIFYFLCSAIPAITEVLPSLSEFDFSEIFTGDSDYYYEGEMDELTTIYEAYDTDKEYPFYYDTDGMLYDEDYKMVHISDYEFEPKDVANMEANKLRFYNEYEDDFIDAFVDTTTNQAYYVIGDTYYDEDDNEVDPNEITIPQHIIEKVIKHKNENSISTESSSIDTP